MEYKKVWLYEHIQKKNVSISDNGIVRMYVCGPTVYDHIHIGNLRPIIVFDILNRLLTCLNYHVFYINNITDVDDKIINKAQVKNQTPASVACYYLTQYKQILAFFQIQTANMLFPKVTEHMNEVLALIERLVILKFAYVTQDGVYFDVAKVSNYGLLANRKFNQKSNFALWKKTTTFPCWPSQFGFGRPGWHSECFALVNFFLGTQIELHGGGVDLKFPHHENENAQNNACFHQNLAKIWMHVGHVNFNQTKMSKSLHNFVLVKDLIQHFNQNHIRWYFLQTKYQKPLDFSWSNLQQAAWEVDDVLYRLNVIRSYLIINGYDGYNKKMVAFEFFAHLQNDLHLPNFVSFLLNQIQQSSLLLKQKAWKQLKQCYEQLVYALVELLGLQIIDVFNQKNINLLKNWHAYIQQKNFTVADQLRQKLIEQKLL